MRSELTREIRETREAETTVIPLSFSQLRFWFQRELDRGGESPHASMALRLTGRPDAVALREALRDVVTRHESLRTVFPVTDGVPGQRILETVTVELPVRRIEEPDVEAAVADAAGHRFDLEREIPLRAVLLAVGPEDDHVLAITVHHMGFDGWSVAPFLRDLSHAYTARVDGRPPDWDELPFQYVDFTLWQRKELGAPDDPGSLFAEQLTHWTRALADAPAELPLPTDRPRPATATHRAGTVPFHLPPDGFRDLSRLALRHGASTFTVLHAALAGFLRRLGAGTDIPVGSPVAGRTDVGLDDLVGCFVNTVVVRTDTSGDPDFHELLQRARTGVMAALDHQDVPFEQVVEAVNPARSAARHPLFQVMLSLQNNAGAAVRLPRLDTRLLRHGPHRTIAFDLLLDITETDGGLDGTLVYARDLFDHDTAERLARRFTAFLAQAVAAPERRTGRLELLSPAERRTTLETWNGGETALPADSVPALFRRRAAAAPDGTAVVCGDVRLTYAELDARADRLTHRLRRAGAGPERLVAVAMNRSADLVVALLAVLKTGAAYLPLDPRNPDERQRAVLEEAGPHVLLADASTRERAEELAGGTRDGQPPVLLLAEDTDPTDTGPDAAGRDAAGPLAPGPGAAGRPDIDGGQAAYAMYTSGSTGRPKGVLVTHRNIVALAADPCWAADGGHTRVLAHSPHSFDASTYELWVPLLGGGTVVMVPAGDSSPQALERAVADGDATSAFLTTALFNQLVAERNPLLGRLRHLWTGGEQPSAGAVRRMLTEFPDTALTHVYGPTENTTFTTFGRLDPDRDADGGKPSIGRPMANTRAYVLDRWLRPVPVGVPGELYLAGAGLARGYLGRPGLTAGLFVADPHGAPGTRMYRTGDLVRWTADGRLDFLTRTDDQVKIRGFRIEPREAEAALERHPAVGRAAVVVREERPGERGLVAYVVPAPGAGGDPSSEIAAHARRTLPDYMVPVVVLLPDGLPLTPNGKLDRAALPAPARNTGSRPPRTPAERLVCGLFAEILGLPEVGADDGFFALGGHSLLAVRLVNRLREVLDDGIGARTVFESPTPAALAARFGTPGAGRGALRPPPRGEVLPPSFSQLRFWLQGALVEDAASHTVTTALRLTGRLDTGALSTALGDVVTRHESLRTVFPVTDGTPRQLVLEPAEFDLPVREVARGEIEAAVVAASECAFDLARERPLRAELLTCGPGDHVLAITIHHIAFDGWSAAPFLRDLSEAYAARLRGRAPDVPELPLQYADFALWQRAALGDPDDPGSPFARQLAHWTGTLAGAPDELPLPTDRPRPAVTGHRVDAVPFRLAPEDHARLTALARRHGASVFMVLHAALAALLRQLGAGTDILVGSPVAGRTDSGLDDLVGCFVNTVVVRTDASGDPDFGELLDRVRPGVLAALENQDVPFERVVDAVAPERSAARHPLFQVMLSLQNNAGAALELPGLHVDTLPHGRTRTVPFDLLFDLAESHGGLDGTLFYARDLFDHGTAERLAGYFTTLLADAAARPTRPVRRLDVLSPAERNTVLTEWSGPAAGAETPQGSVPRWFREQAARTPHAAAVLHGTRSLTYGELDARVERLAGQLRRLGAGPERLIAVAMNRTPGLLVALLAVHRTGAAYLPVDPHHPRDRVASVLSEAAPLLVLSDRATRDALGTDDWLAPDDPGLGSALAGVGGHGAGDGSGNAAEDPIPHAAIPADSTAYVLYTSGSTGRPKGVVVTHRNLAHLLAAMRDRLPLGPTDRLLAVTTVAFDIAHLELLLPLLDGAAVVLASPDEVREPHALGRLIGRQGVTTVQATPSLWSGLVAGIPDAVRGLRVLVGGEALPPALAGGLVGLAAEVTHVYGPTETTIWSLAAPIGPHNAEHPPLGSPLGDTRVYVLDEALRPVPVGVPGELYIGGAGVARGYLGRPGQTAERFVADPYGPPGARLYRTGDLVRWTPDGELDFLGRADDQVKLRGFRIEPREIEAVLDRHDRVIRSAVVVREDRPGERRLVAYVAPVPAAGAADDLDSALTEWARRALPPYMVPAVVVLPDGLPLTPNGKLDRSALPAPRGPVRPAGAAREPSTPAERLLCELFAAVLGRPSVGVEDDFFALGGDSIVSIRLVSRARSRGLAISTRDVFRYRTVAELAVHAKARPPKAGAANAPAAVPSTDEMPSVGEATTAAAEVTTAREVPLTPIVHWQRERGGPVDGFHQSVLVRTPADLTLPGLRALLQSLLDRHDALRTRLTRTPTWHLEVLPRGAVDAAGPVVRFDAAGRTAGELAALIRAETEAARRRLAPGEGTMLQAVWFDAGPGRDGRLLLMINHLVVDGVSWRILLEDLSTGAAPRTSGPDFTPVSFADWGRRLEREARGRASELPFWLRLLEGAHDLVPGAELVAARDVEGSKHTVTRVLPVGRTEPLLARVPARLGVGVNAVLLGALSTAAGRWRPTSGSGDAAGGPAADGGAPFLVEVEGHGREEIADGLDLSATVGWFTSMFPVRLPGRPDDPEGTVRAVEQQLGSMPDKGLGFGLLRHLHPETAPVLRTSPRAQILFNYLGRFDRPEEADWGLAPEAGAVSGGGDPEMPLTHLMEVSVVVHDRGDRPELHVSWAYPKALLERARVEALADAWFEALETLTTCTGEPGETA
ncbi:non-ribosomal peptide synthetase [Streptomyces zaomyceticus]|uniref:non-ribosomal peptide synthetase n=1 Tax=Streptomyces zaomyceticus TaxID=68286 RepID=UPI002E12BBF3|nr:non-ribosomal peptide synthetase [Streptomyces zaomyceticus]WSQ22976.1 amino acid adenylation domain-containing protein [Streptomyces zaomyceticus]